MLLVSRQVEPLLIVEALISAHNCSGSENLKEAALARYLALKGDRDEVLVSGSEVCVLNTAA